MGLQRASRIRYDIFFELAWCTVMYMYMFEHDRTSKRPSQQIVQFDMCYIWPTPTQHNTHWQKGPKMLVGLAELMLRFFHTSNNKWMHGIHDMEYEWHSRYIPQVQFVCIQTEINNKQFFFLRCLTRARFCPFCLCLKDRNVSIKFYDEKYLSAPKM